MNKRNIVFDNLRGICMLGVIAIHVGSYVMESATQSIYLLALCEVLSRYSVPAFFFISGFGLFHTYFLDKPINYLSFIKKRFLSIGVPYLLWSLFYMECYNLSYYNPKTWGMDNLSFTLVFGTGSYHIYFLVILIWFYLLFPLWRLLMKVMEKLGLYLTVPLLALAQLYLYDYSAHSWTYSPWVVQHDFIYNLLQYRLNYFPFFYLFIFMLGGVIARHYASFEKCITKYFYAFAGFFLLSGGYNTYLFCTQVSRDSNNIVGITNNFQQLSLLGFIYTIAAILFFCALLNKFKDQKIAWLEALSDHSFVIYLVHPFLMDQIYYYLGCVGIAFQYVPIQVYYLAVLLSSYGVALLWDKIKVRFSRG